MSKNRTLKPETNGDPIPSLKAKLAEERGKNVKECVDEFNKLMAFLKERNCILHISQTTSRLKGIEDHVQILSND